MLTLQDFSQWVVYNIVQANVMVEIFHKWCVQILQHLICHDYWIIRPRRRWSTQAVATAATDLSGAEEGSGVRSPGTIRTVRAFKSIFVDIFYVLARLRSHSLNNDTIVTFQIQPNLDIQLSFFQLFPGVARKNHPLKTMRIVSLKRGGKDQRSISKCLLASFTNCLGICSLAMPIQYNLCNISGTATAPKLCAIATPTCATRLNHLIFLLFL